MENAQILQILEYHTGDVTSCDVDENFILCSGSADRKVALWTWQPGNGYVVAPFSPMTNFKYPVTSVEFMKGIAVLATAFLDGSVSLWNLHNGQLIHTFKHSSVASVRDFCYSASYKCLISAGDDGTLCLWNINKKMLIESIKAHEEAISVIVMSSDGKIIFSGDTSGTAKVWSVSMILENDAKSSKSTALYTLIDCHDLGILHACFEPRIRITDTGVEYRLITSGNENTPKVWKLVTRKKTPDSYECSVSSLGSLNGHTSTVSSVKFSPQGTLAASTSVDKTARIWDMTVEGEWKCVRVLEGHNRYVTTCAFSPDGKLLITGASDKILTVWDLYGKYSIKSQIGPTLATNFIGMLQTEADIRKNSLLSGKQVGIWQKITDLGNAINSVSFSPNNVLVAAGSDKQILLFHKTSINDGGNGKYVRLDQLSSVMCHRFSINEVDFSRCGTMLLSSSVDGTAVVWDMTRYKCLVTFHGPDSGIKAGRFASNGKLLVTAGDSNLVSVWDLQTQSSLGTLQGHSDTVLCVAFTFDSQYIVSGCASGNIRFWRCMPLVTFCMFAKSDVHDLGVSCVDFCHDKIRKECYLLASGGNDSIVKLWMVNIIDEISLEATEHAILTGHGGDITCVRFANVYKRLLASTATDKTARLWDTISGNCLQVLDSQDSMLTSCAFSYEDTFLATGALNKSVIIWSMDPLVGDLELIYSNARETTRRSSNGSWPYNLSEVPHEFRCPISLQMMRDPVSCEDGFTYEKTAIEAWFCSGKSKSPLTNDMLTSVAVKPNVVLKERIDFFLAERNRQQQQQ